jgi:hypothetical protein
MIAKSLFPLRIKLGLPATGFSVRAAKMRAWLDENCAADSRAMTVARLRDGDRAVAIYFRDAKIAAAFVLRWCAGSRIEISVGAFRLRGDPFTTWRSTGVSRGGTSRSRMPSPVAIT